MAFFVGIMLAFMIYFNSLNANATSPAFSNLFFQTFGLIFFTLFCLAWQKKLPFKAFDRHMILPGILSGITVIISNIVVSSIGVALTVGLSLLGQVITSMVIDEFGLLGKTKNPLTKSRLGGLLCIAFGILLFFI